MKIQCPNCFEDFDTELGMCPHCGYTEGGRAAEALHMNPGTMLQNRYRIGKVLGFGGFGVTYLAWDMVLEAKVAIKEYLPSEFSTRSVGVSQVTIYSGNKEQQFRDGMEKFVAEAKRLAKFQGEAGIVQIFDSFMANNTAYIVMEYLEGETLTAFLEREGTVSADAAIGLLTPVIKSLEVVHAEGIIHRDIAPDNIMITKDGAVKLIDFGAARYATTSHSRSLTVIIKPGYSPEEQYRSRGDQGPYTDVYSAASVLYRMITGVTPPDAMERRAFFENGKKDMLEAPSRYVKNLDTNVETALLNAMNVSIEDRTPDMATFFEELTSEKPVKRRIGRIKKIDVLRWPLWAKITVPTGVVTVAALLILFFTGIISFDSGLQTIIEIPDGMTRVPSVVNDSVENAEPRLETAELLYVIEAYESDSLVPANMILHQEYNAGSVVTVNSLMGLTISKGADMSIVPNITGYEQEEAISYLEEQGLTVTVEEEYSNIIAEGSVITQSVSGGEELERGSMIIITVSKGIDPKMEQEVVMITVPDFNGMTYDEALEVAADVGIIVSVTREYSSEYDEDEVMAQSIKAGEEIYSGNTIYLTVSKGEQIYMVPDVIGEQYEDAIKVLEEQGYVVEINEVENDIYAAGLVFVQEPTAGTELAVGETVSLTVSKGSATFLVKDTVGLTEEEATNTLKAQSLTVSTVYEETAKENVGLVLSQTPKGGTQGNRGDEVIIIVGTDEKTVSVPNVTGKTQAEAQQTLKNSGFSVSVSESSSDTVAKGNVISQTPSAGTNQVNGSTIALVVSTGPESITISNVIGKTETIAVNALESQGFAVRVTYEYNDNVMSGTVVSQSPDYGALGSKGDTVTISISKGSQPISIPNVVGMTQSSARETLATAGFAVSVTESYSDTVTAGNVISQNPTSASTGYAGDTVQLTVSLGKAAVPVSSLTLNKASLTLTEGDSAQLTCTVAPSDASDTGVSYSSSNSSIATVGSNGLVTAKAPGSATITVTSNSGSVKASCTVTVEEAYVTKISISSQPTKTSYYVGDSLDDSGCRLQVTYNNGTIKYISSGYKCTYDFSTSGTKTVKVTYEGCETSYTVTVKQPSVAMSVESLSMFVGDTYTLTTSVLPSGSSVTWSSSSSSVVSVSGGVLTAKTKGSATITAEITYNDTKYQGTCSVTVSSTGVVLDSASVQLYIGDTKTLTATTNPSGQSVTWSSSASGVATVSGGTVTAVSDGSATITASITYGGTTYKATCAVTVISPSLSLNSGSESLYVGDTVVLSAVSLPSGTNVTWSSSNTSVATVSGGTVTAVAAGTTTITASMSYGGKTYMATCSVTVTKPSISLGSSSLSLYVGDTSTPTATVVPSGSTVTWSSSSTSVATITTAGKVTAKAAGTATITAKITYQGTTYSATCSVTVTKPSVTLSSSSLALYVGDTSTLTATAVPSGSTVTWTSSSTSIATVSSSGKVTAVAAGTATITAKITYQGTTYSATCSVTVTKPSISLSSSSLALYVGDTSTLTATTVSGGSTVTWSSSSTSVATVSSEGTVTAKAAGSATITGKITYQGTTYSATCSVTVTKPSISLSDSSLSLYVGDTSTLTATTVPSGASVTWSSSSTSVATVSSGKVTAKGAGSATITASVTYGGTTYKATCSVTVTKPSISLSSSSLSLYVGDTSTLTATTVPSGASVTWSSSSTSVATVSSGKVTAKGAGSATITASVTYGGTTYKATCSVTVTKPSVSLNASSLSLGISNMSTVTATVVPSGSAITWSSSNSSVATVVSTGTTTARVQGIYAGSATITASITYNGTTYKATCSVSVTDSFAGKTATVTLSEGLVVRSDHSTTSTYLSAIAYGKSTVISKAWCDDTRIWGYSPSLGGWISLYYGPNDQWNVSIQ